MTPIAASVSTNQAGAQFTTISVTGGQLHRIKNRQITPATMKLTTWWRVIEEVMHAMARNAPDKRKLPPYPVKIRPRSGCPRYSTVTTIGNVKTSARSRNNQLARNFPRIACHGVTGMVNRSSMVPNLSSSDQRRIPTAGTRKRKSQGGHTKNVRRSADPRSKNLPTMKVKKPVSSRKMTIKTYATGEEKYAPSSL